ncbi:mucin-5AC-like isoform X2 [Portunus trituberculatus]|uniref:mucin-5AC-like isoform X2 n=2 Tax=Portunus trituberculatus TaxID=210409 RepID=UPI001E1CC210|nr:mucin-5AC-like isoform X2 [Portunus trituberculatus]XP_045115783.1 mucin-5AC-like isoform X2 [Portunus trituberculatus]XP_045115784.1 mucin-5AC-like isoform X2 [Portunus trituberculatus]XP_045115785.1 mucin-5AC-like isoform X2 [Portunus trituberculatus]XP_045115786.1 mucin-5AC-like isoform X2 [Portunus trituberculatus]XP_045115787.1 mucin-5AC-like isoform X2 [Portunus trituberculatus]XP_045115788.1 mucin-5AC-like isoform X2 [Portunus trituberculatus]XP_045115789.1 mucin-5AC-like isoform X
MTCHLAPNGGDLLGLLKKFRVTKENEKESEIFTLANLDNGCIRKFIVKKVDESAFLASINRRNKEDSKSLTDENENTAVVGHEEGGDGCPLVPPSPTLPRRNVPAAPIANGHAKPIERKSSSNFKLGCDDDSDDCSSMTVEDKDDPGVINPAFTYEEEEDDDLGRGDGSTTSARSSPETSPSPSPKLHFSSMSPRPSPRQSPVSHRSGNLSHRSSVSSVRKGILKKSGSSSTINMEMVNLGLQNAAIAAGNAANLNGYQRARFTDPYDDNFVPMDTHRFVGSVSLPSSPHLAHLAPNPPLHSSSEENNYAMQQKSLGGHRVKFILETGKPDHVHGSYDDIRIEKMERERIERIESGKDLEVTNMTDRGGKKCLLFCAAMLVLTGAVIVAGLYGSGKLKIITELGGQGITSGLSGGAATTQPPTSSPTIAYVPNAIEVKFKIDNHNFTTDLTNVDSKAYKTMVKDLEAELTKILFPEPVLHNGKANLNLRIIKFEPGSIKCTFRIGWSFFDEQNEQEAPLNLTIIREIFENRINNSFVFLHQQEYRVPPDSIDVDRLVDKCYNNQSLCSHGCKFSYENLRFTCTCPDYLYSINTTTCIHPNKTTTTSTTTSTTTEVAIKGDFNQLIKNVGGAFIAIKLEDIEANTDTEIEAPPTGKETEEESETSEDSKTDEQPKPGEVIVDGTATNATVNATTDGQLPPVNVTEATTTTTTSTTTTSTTTTSTTTTSPVTVPPASNETITEVSADNTTEATNISLISTTTVVAETNSSATKTTTTETVTSKEEQQTTTSQKPTSEEVTIIHEGPEPVLPEHTTIKTENTSVDEIPATSTPTPNVTIVAQDVAPVTTTTEPTVKEDSEPESKPEEAVPGVEEVSNTTHHSNVSISTPEVVNDTISEILQETFINRSALFPENFVSPGTRLEDIMSFANIPGKAIIVLDLSALRPGDSPGNVGLQEVEDESSHNNVTAVNETQTSTPITEESPLHNATTHDAGTKESVSEATTQPVVATSVTTEIPSTSTSSSTTTSTTTTTERHVVIVNASEVSAHEDDLGRDTGEEQVSKEVVTIPAVPYEGNPIFASKTPPPVRTTTTTTSTTPPTTTTTTTTTTSPTTTTTTTTTTQPSVMTENSTTPATTTTTLDYDTKGEEAPVENRDTSILDIAFIASSDLSTMARNTSHDTPAATTTAPTTTTTTITTTTVIEGITNTSQEFPGTNVTAIDTTKDDPALVHINKEVAATSTSAPPKVLCHEDQVECINGTSTWGRCIPRNSRCNSVPDCSDKSDELDCKENNCFGNFQCRDGECIERLYVCDGVTNCQDGDDELNCESWQCKEDELKCGGNSPSPCIPLSLRCDGQPDCIDHSDELNCTDVCRSDEFHCSEGWCIPHVRTCDGRPDCHNGEDEKNCDCSGLDETQCAAGGCVPTFHLCDGLRQCHDGSDEWNCVRIDNSTRQLEVRSGKNRWSAVCGEGWTSKWTDQVCQQLGGSASLSTEMRRVSESVPRPRVQLLQKAVSGGYTPLQFVLKSDCSSDTLVHLSCEEHSCGSWSLGDDILEEHQLSTNTRPPATEGQWPSLALLLRTHPNKNDTHAQGQFCSASIVAPSWILAAYSCLSSKENGLDLGTWAVASGTASPTASTQFHYVGKIVPFPGRVRTGGLWTGDAVLLRLTEPLDLGPNSQPVCVPNTPPVNTAQCVVAGWRRTDEGVGSQSQFLHHLPMPTLALDACNTTHYPGRLNPTHTCVGFSDAQHAPCHGDEGSPLMCRSETGAWRLEGLLTHHTCYGRARHPAIFTALHALQPWLNNTIGTPHVPNGASTSTTTTTTTSTTTTPTTTTTTSTTTTPPTTTVGSTTTTTTTSDATTSTSTTTTSPTTTTTPPPGDGTGSANSTDLEEALPPLSSPGMAPL